MAEPSVSEAAFRTAMPWAPGLPERGIRVDLALRSPC